MTSTRRVKSEHAALLTRSAGKTVPIITLDKPSTKPRKTNAKATTKPQNYEESPKRASSRPTRGVTTDLKHAVPDKSSMTTGKRLGNSNVTAKVKESASTKKDLKTKDNPLRVGILTRSTRKVVITSVDPKLDPVVLIKTLNIEAAPPKLLTAPRDRKTKSVKFVTEEEIQIPPIVQVPQQVQAEPQAIESEVPPVTIPEQLNPPLDTQNPQTRTRKRSVKPTTLKTKPAMSNKSEPKTQPYTESNKRSEVTSELKPVEFKKPGKEKSKMPSLSEKITKSLSTENRSFEDDFVLMPKTKSPVVAPPQKPSATVQPEMDEFEFNDPDSGPSKKAIKPKQKRAKTVPKKAFTSGLKLWDDKSFTKKQKLINVKIINKDFKPKEKPIPKPKKVLIQKKPDFPVMNFDNSKPQPSLRPDNVDQPAVEPLQQLLSRAIDRTNDKSLDKSVIRLTPWRYSSIRTPTFGLVTVTSFKSHDSDIENQIPSPIKDSAPMKLPHTSNPTRSPMKNLDPNDSGLIFRKRFFSPAKPKTFDVDNCFGFAEEGDSQQATQPDSTSDQDQQRFNETIENLRRFRHGLKAPIVRRRLELPQEQKGGVSQPIFTSTPQQTKIRDAFKAVADLNSINEMLDSCAKGGKENNVDNQDEDDLHMFESLTFDKPPRRNYSGVGLVKKRKRVDIYGLSEDEDDDEENANNSRLDDSTLSSRKTHQRKKPRTKKHEEELNQFAEKFNTMCEEVDQFEMVIE